MASQGLRSYGAIIGLLAVLASPGFAADSAFTAATQNKVFSSASSSISSSGTAASFSAENAALGGGGAFNGGGGGNTTADVKLYYPYAQYVEKTAFAVLPYVFQQIEYWSDPALLNSMPEGEMKTLAPSIYSKLFAKKQVNHTVYEVLPTVNVVFLEHGVCESPSGQDVDGSASALDGQNVCLSFERLSQKLNTDSSWPKITALLAHEVSHLLGTTEPEAKFIQKMLEATVTYHQTFSNFTDSRDRLLAQLTDVRQAIEEVQNANNGKEEQTLQCMQVQRVLDSVQLLQNWQVTNTHAGISLLNVADQYAMMALFYQAASLRFFCINSAVFRSTYDKAFNDQPSIGAAKFVALTIDSSSSRLNPITLGNSILIQHVSYGNFTTLAAQLGAMLPVQARLKKDTDHINFKF